MTIIDFKIRVDWKNWSYLEAVTL